MLQGKHIIVGVTGSIAAYKAAILVRELVKAGAEVRVAMTDSACEFITPMTLGTLSQNAVIKDMFPPESGAGTWHIDTGLWADAMIVAPASANTIAKLAYGFADNALCSLALALRCPLLVAPVMDTDMLVHPATQRNIDVLRERGVKIIDPEEGELASGLTGPGRLPEIPVIMEVIRSSIPREVKDLSGKNVLVTAGPTHEKLDPVRYIGNFSSGKMGFAIAEAAAARGANVTLIAGPVHLDTPIGVKRIDIESAEQMFECVRTEMKTQDVIVMSAAVADFRPAKELPGKLKKGSIREDEYKLELVKNPDILEYLGKNKGERTLVGFALETDDPVDNAAEKIVKKNTDMIVLNNPLQDGAGFAVDTNIVTFLYPDGRKQELDKMRKRELAEKILDAAQEIASSR
ncbi:MAG: bifunctional phosphopantothenoylcysteine decarboxylase/phosphopantothenate--cysteine ligase CoaBC [Ectothiorhodospiraceae bacterium]|nr:bifunctional phosphopantothenoylcysteine decarboxylase/phosphopantothenate--cysteine ligase CoaBC [Ectothiorhodospiraceae bacterium]